MSHYLASRQTSSEIMGFFLKFTIQLLTIKGRLFALGFYVNLHVPVEAEVAHFCFQAQVVGFEQMVSVERTTNLFHAGPKVISMCRSPLVRRAVDDALRIRPLILDAGAVLRCQHRGARQICHPQRISTLAASMFCTQRTPGGKPVASRQQKTFPSERCTSLCHYTPF